MTRMNRRDFSTAFGLGATGLAMQSLLAEESPVVPHHPATAKSVILLFMSGGPSQVDTFDPKPELTRWHGRQLPFDNLQTERRTGFANISNNLHAPGGARNP